MNYYSKELIEISDQLKIYYNKFLELMPDASCRTKIFLMAIYMMTFIMFYLTKFFNFILYLVLQYIPDKFIMVKFHNIGKKKGRKVHILHAEGENGEPLTNKLDLYMNLFWDKENDDQSIDINKFGLYVGSSIIWIAYLLECDQNKNYKDFKNKINMNEFDKEKFTGLLKTIIVSIGEKIVYKFNKELDDYEKKGNVIFGELNFDL